MLPTIVRVILCTPSPSITDKKSFVIDDGFILKLIKSIWFKNLDGVNKCHDIGSFLLNLSLYLLRNGVKDLSHVKKNG